MKALATIAGEFWELLDSDGSKAGGILVDGMAAQPKKRQSVDGEQHAQGIPIKSAQNPDIARIGSLSKGHPSLT